MFVLFRKFLMNKSALFCFVFRHTLTPLPTHYLDPLESPLTVILYNGSVCEKDPALLGFDLISCVEL